ncbi:MAG: T9SS type A sorting domain-containing protein [Bacteroidetes bacterium]|nr:T9SS type A sorting domain-containing protein [Bacteroidota bacterium]
MKYATTILFFVMKICVFAQHTNVKVARINSPNEPSITLNSLNPDEMVCGYNINNYCYSNDGGKTWTHSFISSTNGVWGDPCLIADNNNNFYFFHLSNPQDGSWIDRIVCQKSSNGGEIWNNGSCTGLNGDKNQDKSWATFDIGSQNIYVTWTQFDNYGSTSKADSTNILFSKSSDLGETWSQAIRINQVLGDCVDDDNTVEGAVPTTGINGEIYVSWAGPEGIVFDRSSDYGETWLDKDIFVVDQVGGWDMDIPGIQRCNGMPITVCDTSNTKYRGTIYICYGDKKYGEDDADVWIVKSTDNGDTWSIPKRVNNDGPGKHQFFPWMTVDQVTGYVYVVFYDRRNYQYTQTDVYMAVSKDGGKTFSNFKISESPFTPDAGVFFGDYNNITAYNNVVRPVWTRFGTSASRGLSIWTAIIDTDNMVGISEPVTENLNLQQNYPNPFSAQTFISFKLRQRTNVSLVVFDIFGREIEKIINNEKRNPGKYLESFNAKTKKLKSGVYYFSLITPRQRIIKKMIIQ